MASKKKSNQNVQTKVHNEQEWTTYMNMPGLKVVDAYSEWCGPCTALKDALKKLKAEVADDLLQLGTAPADHIADLERYRGTCVPQFLFFGGENGKNTLLHVIRGANAPEVARQCKLLVEKEHDCIQNGTARVEFKDDAIEEPVVVEAKPVEAAPAPATKTFAVVLVKPAVAACEAAEEQLDEIFAAVAEAGLRVVHDTEIDFNDEANEGKLKTLFAARASDEGYDALIESCGGEGKSKLIVLSATDGDATTIWNNLANGPAEPAASAEGEAAPAEGEEANAEGNDEAGANEESQDLGVETKSVIQEKYGDSVVGSNNADEAAAQINEFFAELAAELAAPPAPEPEESDKAEGEACEASEATAGEAAATEGGEADATPAAPAEDGAAPAAEEAATEGEAAAAPAEGAAEAEGAPAEGGDAPAAEGEAAATEGEAAPEAEAPAAEEAAPAEAATEEAAPADPPAE